uniref:Metalloendopeptidase n=2 Tax=Sinocyclocheilus rhinocerous TaxID=307959 RepID=A0A673FX05_9TELE
MFVTKVTFGLLALLLVFSVRAEEMVRHTNLYQRHLYQRQQRHQYPKLMDDIAVNERNIYVPYVIANHYSSREVEIIKRGLDSFSYSTCIHFFPRSNERDYISIESRSGCYSYVGRQGYSQTVSLDRNGCLYPSTVQHELLHALGFNHEQTRSDRDNHIQVIWENIIDEQGRYH